jgi:polar amino acid transport system permease protein
LDILHHLANSEKEMDLMSFDISEVTRYFPLLLLGLKSTIIISAVSIVVSIIIGTIAGLMRVSDNRFLYYTSTVYIEWIRGTPLMQQLLFVYFGLGMIVNISAMSAAILGLSIFSGAYIAEIVRAGIESIPKGQTEAALSLGMNYTQTMKHIILPQAIRVVLPPICSQFISLIKDSSLVSVLSITELTYMSKKIVAATMSPFEIYLTVGLMYAFITITLSQLIRKLERRLRNNA